MNKSKIVLLLVGLVVLIFVIKSIKEKLFGWMTRFPTISPPSPLMLPSLLPFTFLPELMKGWFSFLPPPQPRTREYEYYKRYGETKPETPELIEILKKPFEIMQMMLTGGRTSTPDYEEMKRKEAILASAGEKIARKIIITMPKPRINLKKKKLLMRRL